MHRRPDNCSWREGGQMAIQAEHIHSTTDLEGKTCSYGKKTWKAAWVSGLQSRAGVTWHQVGLQGVGSN